MTHPPTGQAPGAIDAVATPAAAVSTRAYPLLLLASTAIAAAFCYLYITKPLISIDQTPIAISPTSPAKPLIIPETTTPPAASLLPNSERLPGDTPAPLAAARRPRHAPTSPPLPGNPAAPSFEETNLSIQHVLTAKTPTGDLGRIVLNVPVLYQTRTLAWTDSEVAESRELLKRLTTYQENSIALRKEGTILLAAWNRLVESSIPTTILRADSPALPANQNGAASNPSAENLNTTESIQIQPAEK